MKKRADYQKIRQAMANKGFTKQLQVAQRIAEIEGIPDPPTSLVSRVFNGESVQGASIARVAAALDVSAEDLYQSDERTLDETGSLDDPAAPPVPKFRYGLVAAIGLLFVSALLIGLWPRGDQVTQVAEQDPPETGAVATTSNDPPVKPLRIGFLQPTGDRADEIVELLQSKLKGDWPKLSVRRYPFDGDWPAVIDRLIAVEVSPSHRNLVVRVSVLDPANRTLVWTDDFLKVSDSSFLNQWLNTAKNNIHGFLLTGGKPETIPLNAQKRYLSGLNFLDQSRTELNLRRAQSEFESALRLAPDWSKAHAGLCRMLVDEHLRTGAVRHLDDAQIECDNAMKAKAPPIEALLAVGNLQRKRGDLENSEKQLSKALAQDQSQTEVLLELSEVHLAKFLKSGDQGELEAAESYTDKAMVIEPDYWKGPFGRARLHYMRGQLEQAITMSERSLVLNDQNHVAYSNLGTMHLCVGNMEAARNAYGRSHQLAPNSAPGSEHLGVAHYFLGEYGEAAQYFKEAIDVLESADETIDHRFWGNYADALRRDGQQREAVLAYDRALQLVEASIVDGELSQSHRAHRVYYHVALNSLTQNERTNSRSAQFVTSELSELENSMQDPAALMRLATARAIRGEMELARQSLNRTEMSCAGFLKSPDLIDVMADTQK